MIIVSIVPYKKRPGLVVMGDDSYSRGRGFESRHRILDGHESPGLAQIYMQTFQPVKPRSG